MRIVCISNEKDTLRTTVMMAGLAEALGVEDCHVLVLDPDPRVPLVDRAAVLPNLGHSLLHAFTDANLPYDHVLFHCPASFHGLAMSALAAADLAMLPTATDESSIAALECTLRTVAMVERLRGQTLPVVIVPTQERVDGPFSPYGCSLCTVYGHCVPENAPAPLQRLASWLMSEGLVFAQTAGLSAA